MRGPRGSDALVLVEMDVEPLLQQQIQRADRRRDPGGIAVVRDHHAVGVAGQKSGLLRRERGAEIVKEKADEARVIHEPRELGHNYAQILGALGHGLAGKSQRNSKFAPPGLEVGCRRRRSPWRQRSG